MPKNMLITKSEMEKLLANGRKSPTDPAFDPKPVIKLFNPTGAGTWLISEVDPENPDIAFGLADLGMGSPELGSISLTEIKNVRGRFGLPIERDRHFAAKMTIGEYAEKARQAGKLVA